MPTGSTTITDQASGNEVATWTITEDSVTKHIQRVRLDHRMGGRRFSMNLTPSGGVTALTAANAHICGIMAGTSTIYIHKMYAIQYNAVAGFLVPIGVKRATTLAAGTLVTAANVPKLVTTDTASDAVIRYGSGITASKDTERLILLVPQGTVGAINSAGVSQQYEGTNVDDLIVLTTGQALVFECDIASDTDNRYHVWMHWEEVAP